MCGIAAIARTRPASDPRGSAARAALCADLLKRRGPDSGAMLDAHDGRITLIHRRLAIQDLSAAASQPMVSPDGRVSLVFNGEIYNAPALREDLRRAGAAFTTHSDTEVLLHALGVWGLDETLERLRGMFAFVAIRRGEAGLELEAAVDHAAMKPLVWSFNRNARDGAALSLASDADALLALLPEKPALDPVGLCHVLSVGYCPQPTTVWKGVHALRPGHALRWSFSEDEPPRVSRWWQPPETLDVHAAAPLGSMLESVVHEHLIGDVPVGVFLSAGLDSTAIAAALRAAERGHEMPVAFSLTSGGPDDESAEAAETARMLGMRHEVVRLAAPELPDALRLGATTFDMPQGFSALVTAACLAKGLRASEPGRYIKVVLGGDGGDEAFAGYAWHRDHPGHPLALQSPMTGSPADHRTLARRVASADATGAERAAAALALGGLSYPHRYVRRLFNGFHPAESAALLGSLEPEYDESVFVSFIAGEDRPGLPHPRRAQRLDTLGFCAGSINPKVDRACMGVGLELRAPFLDRRLLELGLAMPVTPGEPAKAPIRAYLRTEADRARIPARVLTRPKQGFSLRLQRTTGDGSGPMAALRPIIDGSRLVADGVLRPDYERFFPMDAEGREVRWFTLGMLAAWYDARF